MKRPVVKSIDVNDVLGTIFGGKSSFDSVMQSFEPFIHNGFVLLSSDLTNSNPVKILRDTGASQSHLLANTLPFSDVSFTGTDVLNKGVDSTEFTSIPLHNTYLSSDLVSGHVVVGILPSLPFDGVHLLLGNDLAGSKVEVNPLVTDKPSVDPNTDSIEQEIPGLFPSCAVTCSMSQSKSTSDDVTTDVDLADTFISRMINDDNVANVTNDDCSAKAQTFSKSGNQYLLIVMCASTRFLEAIPLVNISAKTIVKALIKSFTLVGLPKSIQSDQGSNFMSGLFQQVMDELGIKQYISSAYHLESQSALERFHQTLKNMIRSYCFDTNSDWDEGVNLLLFAFRESVQESLGFSPIELLFGHTVRGPLKLFKENLL